MTDSTRAIDFSRSYCHYVPAGHTIWVRIQAECFCEVIDTRTGLSDEYVLGARTQTGLRTNPPSDALDPGYDFWMTFSKEFVYVKRNHASSHTNNPTRVPVQDFISTGWHLEPAPARVLSNAAEILVALKRGDRLTARTTFTSVDRLQEYRIEYPIKWADGDPVSDAFRVETGPVLLLDPDKVSAGVSVEFDDFTWSYLDYHDFERVRCLIERPTSVLTGATYSASPQSPRRFPSLDQVQLEALRTWLFESGGAPIDADALELLMQTNHYSQVEMRNAVTEVFSLDK